MKRIIPALTIIVFSLFLLLAPPAQAQAPASTAAISQPGRVVVVYLYALKNSYNPSFDTGGQLVGGLNSAELSTRFFRTSAATILNFMAENGYRVVGFAAKPAEIFNNSGGGLEGYTVLLEQVR
ncbi:hypothetical protein ACFP2F_20980 [Hymenobacter artigasi]|uniref:Uncharacterized protein n=1 Tax=Hymenobacter artigasi TaxID=2719616 RepID=A0ABX1HPG8_9BACT|nr:hypothetical protein [Hymenobacter artigasi]NKI91735.1 hypothetical protein [Hymenobacter artigasi]